MGFKRTIIEFLDKDKYYLLILAGIIFGAVYINYIYSGTINNTDGLSDIGKISGISIDGRLLWKYIFVKRIKDVFILFLLSCTTFAMMSISLYMVYTGLCIGIVFCTTLISTGINAVAIFMAMFMPHYIMYIAAVVLMIKYISKKNINIRKTAAYFVLILIIVTIGTMLEAFVNPVIMKSVLNQFSYI